MCVSEPGTGKLLGSICDRLGETEEWPCVISLKVWEFSAGSGAICSITAGLMFSIHLMIKIYSTLGLCLKKSLPLTLHI